MPSVQRVKMVHECGMWPIVVSRNANRYRHLNISISLLINMLSIGFYSYNFFEIWIFNRNGREVWTHCTCIYFTTFFTLYLKLNPLPVSHAILLLNAQGFSHWHGIRIACLWTQRSVAFLRKSYNQWPRFSLQSTSNDPLFKNFNVKFCNFVNIQLEKQFSLKFDKNKFIPTDPLFLGSSHQKRPQVVLLAPVFLLR